MKKSHLAVVLSLFLLASACRQEQTAQTDSPQQGDSAFFHRVTPPSPEWAQNATIYEVNVRQFSPEGTLRAVEKQLPRLKEMGVDIVWLMPIHPISKERRKEPLGSPYAVADYKAINPDYGTLKDFKSLVTRAHNLGLRVIMDWVPNHTGWDHPWIKEHPDWYTKVNGKITHVLNEKGELTDWTDIADLNYNNPDLRRAMIDAMQYWLRECDIDGYRVDVAGLVPKDFWVEVRPALDKIKPVFMLAENEDAPDLFRTCFNMNYGWSMHNMMKAVAKGARPAFAIDSVLERNRQRFPAWYYQMQFTQNHDENSWHGTLQESFGPGADAFVVLTCTLEGMPLVYNGMESNLNKRLQFFEKDTIRWGNYAKSDFFKALLTLKHRNRALWNGQAGGQLVKISTDQDDKVYAFYRQKEDDRVAVILNLSAQPVNVRLNGTGYEGKYMEVFTRRHMALSPSQVVSLKPWEYQVFTN